MRSHAKLAGHAIHQQLIVFPLGLLGTAVLFDVLERITGNEEFATASYLMIAAGLLSGIAASVFGTIDYLAVPHGTRARRVGMLHGLGNMVVLALFALSWLLRDGEEHVASTAALTLALLGAAVSGLTGWLGGELVGRLGVGVDDEAGLDTPASFETGIRSPRADAGRR